MVAWYQTDGDLPVAYGHPLVLARADLHVAWRGNEVPNRTDTLIARLRGEA